MSDDLASLWPVAETLAKIDRGPMKLALAADAAVRAAVAERLELEDLAAFTAQVRLAPWLDGAQVDAEWSATATRRCGLTLAPFDVTMRGAFRVRLVARTSPNAPSDDAELSLDPEAEDPPDVLDGDEVAVGALLIEHLALELDPFPRAPGARFSPPDAPAEISPFAALAALRPKSGGA